jgi:membrane-associated protease RseP (regulator of RpoE activity)
MAPEPFTASGPATTPDFEPVFVSLTPARRRFQHKWWLHILLFLVTLGTTTALGIEHYLAFISNFGARDAAFDASMLLPAFWYSISILAILGAHEMGHYLACRWYNVDATLPYFLPFPSLSGTMGAVIKIREPFPTRTALFDIGIAGPIAGFVVLLPLLFWGMQLSNVQPVPHDMVGYALGEPVLFKLASWLRFGSVPDGYDVNIHPMVFAAWFGMLATAWNLLPFGQLDGGHVTYATVGESSRWVSLVTVSGCIAMCFVSYSWLLMTVMLLAMLFFLGSRHPRPIDEYEPLAPGRRALAIFAIVMFALCFTPVPIDVLK